MQIITLRGLYQPGAVACLIKTALQHLLQYRCGQEPVYCSQALSRDELRRGATIHPDLVDGDYWVL